MRVRGRIVANLRTGARRQEVIGEGQIRLEPINPAALKEFVEEMEKRVIPRIVRTVRRRAQLAEVSRRKVLL